MDKDIVYATLPTFKVHSGDSFEVPNDLIADLAEAFNNTPEWISIKDRLPDDSREVLIHNAEYREPLMIIGWYSHDFKSWVSYDVDNLEVTHWMPLPEPPKAKD